MTDHLVYAYRSALNRTRTGAFWSPARTFPNWPLTAPMTPRRWRTRPTRWMWCCANACVLAMRSPRRAPVRQASAQFRLSTSRPTAWSCPSGLAPTGAAPRLSWRGAWARARPMSGACWLPKAARVWRAWWRRCGPWDGRRPHRSATLRCAQPDSGCGRKAAITPSPERSRTRPARRFRHGSGPRRARGGASCPEHCPRHW